ncbi:serine O-acetyltransferase [Acetobacter sp. DsW_063]|uniref:serine O-acetyltransferase n=1 Tax=Acetobacter sp. DsW_063 TaxID=1514894 RepID=UPI000A3779E2|nr:serine O-acetyltransferase [Acetobacter sp. DsW_063]
MAPSVEWVWGEMLAEARNHSDEILNPMLHVAILEQTSFATALAFLLSCKLGSNLINQATVFELIADFQNARPAMVAAAAADLSAIRERDPAAANYVCPFLFFKGFHSIQSYRIAHWLWRENRKSLACYIQSRASELFAVDIHPAAVLGQRILFDHGTGIVVGETAVVEDDVALLQNVTLGGTGKGAGDRHPKIRRGAVIGTGAKVLGNIEVGEGAKVGAGSIVLRSVAPFTTVVGNPARMVGERHVDLPSLTMDQSVPPADFVI